MTGEKRKTHHTKERENSRTVKQKRKMHHTNERGKKVDADVKSNSKLNEIKLRCRNPNSPEEIIFKEVSGSSDNHQFYYNLDSYCCMHGTHYIRRHNRGKRSFLTHNKYTLTLKEWLEQNKDNWCGTYRKWKVNRPKEEARQLIQCILYAVCNLHSKGIFHGFLHHLENIFIDRDKHKKIKHVYLVYEKMEPQQNEEMEPQQKDILAVSCVIFNQILRGRTEGEYPEDLVELKELLSIDKISYSKLTDEDWKLIVDHPSLWHWKTRFSYIERVWMQFLHADKNLKEAMENIICLIPEYNWVRNIPRGTPLYKIFLNNSYKEIPVELLRYIRVVRFHYKDSIINKETGEPERYVNEHKEPEYLHEQYIEHKTTMISERLLVYMHKMVCKLGIQI